MAARALRPAMLAVIMLVLLAAARPATAQFGAYSEDASAVLWKCSSRNGTAEEGRPGAAAAEVTCSCDGVNMTRVPAVMPRMHRLIIENSLGMEVLRKDALHPYSHSLTDVELRSLPNLETIEEGVFASLSKLRSVYILGVPKLKAIPSGVFQDLSPAFKVLRISRTGLREIPAISSQGEDRILHQIDLESNDIQQVPSQAVRLRAHTLVLDYNAITEVHAGAFNGSEIAELSLKGNRRLTQLSLGAFRGLSSLRKLDLSQTSISELPTEGLQTLEELRIEDTTSLTTIPSVYNFRDLKTARLTYAFHCCAFAHPQIHDAKRHEEYLLMVEKIMTACRDMEAARISPEIMGELLQSVGVSRPSVRLARDVRDALDGLSDGSGGGSGDGSGDGDYAEDDANAGWGDVIAHDSWGAVGTAPPINIFVPQHDHQGAFGDVVMDTGGMISDQPKPDLPGALGGLGGHGGHVDLDHGWHPTAATLPPGMFEAICGNVSKHVPAVECSPAPDALNPCEDIMGYAWLRGLVWVVVLATVVGNVAVLGVLLAHMAALTVARFLMCQLAFADLCMGIYLLLLAAMDLRSHGEYFNFACSWQVERGCMVAGFLTVFSSQLSIYTLCVITLERWVAITYAIDLNKRLRLGTSVYVMAAGWLYAVTMAALPLAGVSSYSSTSICLPMDSRDPAGLTYLVTLLVVAALAFVLVLVCYLHIYLSLGPNTRHNRRPTAPVRPVRRQSSSSSRRFGFGGASRRPAADTGPASLKVRKEFSVANKMALLVLTDFTCWAPIAFFSMTALAGSPLISVTNSKILLVFFYPLNACANPFLYAITTPQYRRDLSMLLDRFGICTHLAQRYKLQYHSTPTSHNSAQPVAMSQRHGHGQTHGLGGGAADAQCYDGPGGPETMTSLLSVTPPTGRNQHREEAFV